MVLVPDKKIEFSVPLEHQDEVKSGQMPKVLIMTRLQIINNSPQEVLAYKLKTNNPKSYKVQPTQGVVPANNTASIEITLVPNPENNFAKNKF